MGPLLEMASSAVHLGKWMVERDDIKELKELNAEAFFLYLVKFLRLIKRTRNEEKTVI